MPKSSSAYTRLIQTFARPHIDRALQLCHFICASDMHLLGVASRKVLRLSHCACTLRVPAQLLLRLPTRPPITFALGRCACSALASRYVYPLKRLQSSPCEELEPVRVQPLMPFSMA